MVQINLSVSGMTCGSCVKHVTKALESLGGVSNIHVDLQSGKVNLQRITNETGDLINALNEEGYPASLDLGGTSAPRQNGGCGGGCSCS